MTAIISTTYDDRYLWYLPLTTWAWNKLGVDVIVFMPDKLGWNFTPKGYLIYKIAAKMNFKTKLRNFKCKEHKEATYSQCSRLYAACLDLPEDEVLVTSDIDMLLFRQPPYNGGFTVFGADLVPSGQYPMCYVSATVKDWRDAFDLNGKTYQECLDETIGKEECENMRGNLWCRDQETIKNKLDAYGNVIEIGRAKPGTQFASHRYDRDDAYILSRLSLDTIDYHMNRPGYEEYNFNIILSVLKFHYPTDNFDWLIDYNEKYKQLL